MSGSQIQQRLQKLLQDWYKIQVEKFDGFDFRRFTFKNKSGQEEIDEAKLKNYIMQATIEELGIVGTAMDTSIVNNILKQPLLLEIKEIRNVSQPFQRDADPVDEEGVKKPSKKKDATYQLKAHDGKRLIKIILLFDNQSAFIRNIYEINKFCLYDAYLSSMESSTFVLDYQEQIVQLYMDKSSPKLEESYTHIQGLPVKYTSAPRFVFLGENAQEEGTHQEEEQEDEFTDLYKKFNIPDLVSNERTYIKRFEQLGFWRKKYAQ